MSSCFTPHWNEAMRVFFLKFLFPERPVEYVIFPLAGCPRFQTKIEKLG